MCGCTRTNNDVIFPALPLHYLNKGQETIDFSQEFMIESISQSKLDLKLFSHRHNFPQNFSI